MGIERFLKKSDGFEVDEPVEPERIPPVGPGGGPGFGMPVTSGKSTVLPATSKLPNVSGLKELMHALRLREAASGAGGDEAAERQATAQALEAMRQIESELGGEVYVARDLGGS
jgi:hypothetical protein